MAQQTTCILVPSYDGLWRIISTASEKRICWIGELSGMNIERVNIVIYYDFPAEADQYLHRVGCAGRFGTKGLAISFIASAEDKEILKQVQDRFQVSVDIARRS